MARPLRIEYPGGVFHVTARGDRREPIFLDDDDRVCLLGVVAQAMDRFDAAVLAYCLMGNHYHFVLQTRRGNLSQLMRHVNGVYAQTFNRRHELTGHLFQGRFTAIVVDRDAYLMAVCRYTELNPVRAGIAKCAGEWPWSSYRAHCGFAGSPWWLDSAALHGYLLGHDARSTADRARAAEAYVRLVECGQDDQLWKRALRNEIYLGDESFIADAQARATSCRAMSSEIPRVQRRLPSAASFVPRHSERDKMLYLAYIDGGLSMSQIAAHAGISVSRVSRLVARFESRLRRAPESVTPACGNVARGPVETSGADLPAVR